MTNPFSKLGKKIKKDVKRTGKGVKKVGNKTKKNLNKGLKSYDKVNKKIKKNLKGTGLGGVYDVTNKMINPVEQANTIRKNKKAIAKGANEFSKQYDSQRLKSNFPPPRLRRGVYFHMFFKAPRGFPGTRGRQEKCFMSPGWAPVAIFGGGGVQLRPRGR